MENDPGEGATSCYDRLPERYVIVFLSFLVLTYGFASAHPLGVGVEHLIQLDELSTPETCPHLGSQNNQSVSENTNKTFPYRWHGIDDYGEIRRYHSLGAAVGVLIGGYLSDTYDAKRVAGLPILSISIMHFLTPVMVTGTHGSTITIGILRFLDGILLGIIFPGVTTVLSHWVPQRERALLTCLANSGLFFGIVAGKISAMMIIALSGSWTTPFYVAGATGLGIYFIWLAFGCSDPRTCQRVYAVERLYLEREIGNTVSNRKRRIPLGKILSSLDVWALVIGSFGHLWYWNVTIPFLVKFMMIDLKLEIGISKIWAVLPFVIMILCSLIFAAFSDWATRNEYITVTTARKVFTNIGTAGPAIYAVAAIFGGCNRTLVQINVMISMGLAGSAMVGIRLVPTDLAPNYSGFLAALANCIGTFNGFLVLGIMRSLVPDHTLDQYKFLSLTSLGVSLACNVFFVLLGGTDIKEWNYPRARRGKKE